ncbi:hypothetical protein KFU94_67565 [Chloroflexi bacterium TSY]|nr:hypothetical protein [Chloroflexi bacterium TSY]
MFDHGCQLNGSDQVVNFALPGATGEGFFHSHSRDAGEEGTLAAGLYGYQYRIDLANAVIEDESSCLLGFSLAFGPIIPVDYDGDGSLDDAYIITEGAEGTTEIDEIEQSGNTITVRFGSPVCPGEGEAPGDSSYVVGLTSAYPERVTLVQLESDSAPLAMPEARTPNFALAPPVAHTQTVSTDQDNSMTITLSGSHQTASALTFSIVSQPAGTLGNIVPRENTSADVTYTPPPSFVGMDSFQFQVENGNESTDTATVLIQVLPVSTLYFVWGDGRFVSNEMVQILCYKNEDAPRFLSKHQITTDGAGRPTTPLPTECTQIAALHQQHEQPSGRLEHGAAYWVYATSWRTGSGTPEHVTSSCQVTCASNERVAIRREWPLVLFNPVVALEWEPSDERFETELEQGFRIASAYLADLTDGYMAFKRPTIYTGGQHWYDSDLRFHVANDLRPAAFVGGIVSDTLPYTLTSPILKQTPPYSEIGTVDIEVDFEPGATYYGRYWNGNESHVGKWNDPKGARTIVHEWMHYALFLYDEYGHKGDNGAPAYCTCSVYDPSDARVSFCSIDEDPFGVDGQAASVMAFHYTASELWHPSDQESSLGACLLSTQRLVHGESDWETLERWFDIQGIAGLTPLRAPDTLPYAPSRLTPATVLSASMNDPLAAWGPLAALYDPTPLNPISSNPSPLNPIGSERVIYLPLLNGATRDADVDSVVASANLDTETTLDAMVTTVDVIITEGATVIGNTATQAYLLQGRPTEPPNRILHQGTGVNATGTTKHVGEIEIWGHDADDQLRIFVDRYTLPSGPLSGAGRFRYVTSDETGIISETTEPDRDEWGSSLDLDYQLVGGNVVTMTAVLNGKQNSELVDGENAFSPIIQICVPDTEIGCPEEWNRVMTYDNGQFKAIFDFRDFPNLWSRGTVPPYGLLSIERHPQDTRAETEEFDGFVRWFRDGGGVGPAHCHEAPLRDGLLMVDTANMTVNQPDPNCNRVMMMPAANYEALFKPLQFPNGGNVTKLVGMPLDVDILFGPNCQLRSEPGTVDSSVPLDDGTEPDYGPVKLTMFYSQEAIERAGLTEADEANLIMMRFDRLFGLDGNWTDDGLTATVTRDSNLNWVSVEGIVEDGIYAIVWQAP